MLDEEKVSTDSDVKEVRIQARRERMAKRTAIEAVGGPEAVAAAHAAELAAAAAAGPAERAGIKPAPVVSEAKVGDIVAHLGELERLATDKVDLVRITTDFAEAQRRMEDDEARASRLARLRRDDAQAQAKVASLSKQWDVTGALTHAEDLRDGLETLQRACSEVLTQKDALLNEFRTELKQKDDDFVKSLRAHAADVQSMLDYIAEHSRTLWDEYRVQLNAIEAVFMQERSELLAATRKDWEKHMATRRELEERQMQDGQLRTLDHEQQLDHLHLQDTEEYRLVRLKLEQDIELLQQQLMMMRATYQMNSEKLDYNFQVLKKRDEENTAIASQQKRRLNRLQDVLASTNARVAKQERQFQDENVALTEDQKRIVENLKELRKKAKSLQAQDQTRFDAVWDMNEEACVALARKTLALDQVLHEQQLGLRWVAPASCIFDPAFDASQTAAITQPPRGRALSAVVLPAGEVAAGDPSQQHLQAALVLLSDGADFLIETKVLELLAGVEPKERCLLKLDAIFKSLGVDSEAQVAAVASYLMRDSDGAAGLISIADVPAALRQFVEDYRLGARTAAGADDDDAAAGVFRDKRGRAHDFWLRLKESVPAQHERVWDALGDGLALYKDALIARKTAIDDCAALRTQNAELRALLTQYMGSDTARALQNPPLQGTAFQLQTARGPAGSSIK